MKSFGTFLKHPAIAWTVAGLAIVSAAVALLVLTRPPSVLPEDVRAKLTFSPLVVESTSEAYSTSSYKFNTAENNEQILSYITTTPYGAITVSQYSQPPAFVDIPEYKDRFLDNVVKRYATVQTANGAIYLGRTTKQDNKQLGVMLERGLIVWLNPEKELSEAQWREFGDLLELQKISR